MAKFNRGFNRISSNNSSTRNTNYSNNNGGNNNMNNSSRNTNNRNNSVIAQIMAQLNGVPAAQTAQTTQQPTRIPVQMPAQTGTVQYASFVMETPAFKSMKHSGATPAEIFSELPQEVLEVLDRSGGEFANTFVVKNVFDARQFGSWVAQRSSCFYTLETVFESEGGKRWIQMIHTAKLQRIRVAMDGITKPLVQTQDASGKWNFHSIVSTLSSHASINKKTGQPQINVFGGNFDQNTFWKTAYAARLWQNNDSSWVACFEGASLPAEVQEAIAASKEAKHITQFNLLGAELADGIGSINVRLEMDATEFLWQATYAYHRKNWELAGMDTRKFPRPVNNPNASFAIPQVIQQMGDAELLAKAVQMAQQHGAVAGLNQQEIAELADNLYKVEYFRVYKRMPSSK